MKKPKDYEALLKQGRWFDSLNPALRSHLLEHAQLRRFKKGECFFQRGDAPNGFFAIVEGAVRISGVGASGEEAILAVLQAPNWFGEISLIDDQPRTHDARAESSSGQLLHISMSEFEAMVAAEPILWKAIGKLVTTKLRLTFSSMEEAVLHSIGERLAGRLAMMARGYGDREGHSLRRLEVSQDALARMMGSSRQTINANLQAMAASGCIALGYGSVEIVDLAALSEWGRNASE